MKDKIKVLMFPSDNAGVGHYRQIWPAQQIESAYGDEFFVEINLDHQDVEYYKQFDIIHFHRQMGPYENLTSLVSELRKSGVITVMDIDDYWMPSKTHPMYVAAMNEKLPEKITAAFKTVDYVTTTTDVFATYISKYNKNVKVIPNGIDMTQPMWQDDDFKKSDKVRISWIGGSCYDNKTEILTNNGFKFFKDLKGDEKVACLNPVSNELEFHKPKGYIKEPFKGKLNCGQNSLIDYAVTPNHNMYVSVADSLTQKNLDFKLIQSEKVFGKNMHFKKDAIWIGEESEVMVISKIYEQNKVYNLKLEVAGENVIENNLDSRSDKYFEDLNLNMDLWLKFFGFWIAEGWTSTTPGLFQVGVAQTKNNGYLEEIFDTLQQLGFNPTYTNDNKQVRVFDKRLWKYLSQFGKAENKFVPKEILNLCPRQLNIFLDWFLKGDGNQETDGIRFDKRYNEVRNYSSSRKRGYTVSKTLADNIQEICLKLGVISTITNRGLRNSIMKDGRKVIAKHDAYVISIGSNSKRSRKTPLLRADDQTQLDYDDFVYCVEVPHNIIYVRRNGKTMWCGNSHLNDLEILTPSMNVFHNDESLRGKYQFVMCGYDTRGFMTEVGPNGEYLNTRKIAPSETIWNKFEEIFTDKYNTKIISEDYKKYLLKCANEDYKKGNVYDGAYVRRWTLPLTRYGEHYNYCDVCLAPLAENIFNEVKSELKIIEAGLKRKALIAQDYGIYKHLIEDGKTGILVNKNDNTRGWYKAMKRVVEDADYRNSLADNLYEFVKDKYTLEAVTKTRVEFYRQIIEQRNSKLQVSQESASQVSEV